MKDHTATPCRDHLRILRTEAMGALAAQRQATEDIGKLLPGLLHEAFIEPVSVLWPFKSTKPAQ